MAVPIFVWNGTAWEATGPTIPANPIKYQASAPSSPSTGDIWVDSDADVTTGSQQFQRFRFVASGGETTISGADANGAVLAYTAGFTYPMIDYGFGINSQFKVTEMFPALFVKTIIDKMFLDAGFTYQSTFFETQLFKKLVIPYNGGSSLKLTAENVRDRTMRASRTNTLSILNDLVAPQTHLVSFTDETTPPNFDTGNNWYDINAGTDYQTFVVPKSGTYTITNFIKANITHQPSTATAELTASRRMVGQMWLVKNNTTGC